jgi:ATP-dependent 26S proteasome regulatory subunit
VAFYYPFDKTDKVDGLISELEGFQLSETETEFESDQNIFTISIGQSGLELEPIEQVDLDLENIDYYYDDGVMKQVNKLSKKIKKSNKGLSIIYGERGTGKTSLVHYMNQKIGDKKVIFIPSTFFDSTINHPDFRNFLKKHRNSIILLDDCEIYFNELYSKSNIFTNNLLQLVDGFDSDQLGINLILILNCEKESEIDPHLIESNNLLDIVKISKLDKIKIQELCKILEKKCKFKSDTKLIEVLKNKPHISGDSDIGFI